MRTIDADSLQRRICGAKCGCEYEDCGNEEGCVYDHFISNTTTIDAVPVVRCRECKYWGDEDGKLQDSDGVLFARCKVHNYLIDGRHTGWCPTENDFCSYGERKEGADNG